ncbi:MAG TPA: methyltransferase domain-containing protein [Burkholderiaceae bacterium]|nr:methyltransferase domain-containing protein [Burkholderiaceae bacterium]
MSSAPGDTGFLGSIPAIYESHMVPLIFEPYATDLAARLRARSPASVLEIAAGTGVATRALANALPAGAEIIATDLNPAMLQEAQRRGTSRPVSWQAADAMQLPLSDASVDAVVCQFGVMFLPDKAKGFAETRRVLKPGGVFLFNVWDRIDDNEIADVVTQALATVFPHDPPLFMARIPHGYHDLDVIHRDLAAGGFSATPRIESIDHRSRAASARAAAITYCHGTPLRNEIEARDAAKLAEATDVCAAALAARFGSGVVDAKIRAHVVMVVR